MVIHSGPFPLNIKSIFPLHFNGATTVSTNRIAKILVIGWKNK